VKVTVSSKITVRISFTQSFQCFNCCASYIKRVEEKSKGGNTSMNLFCLVSGPLCQFSVLSPLLGIKPRLPSCPVRSHILY
jgi:hypothetical protein